MSLCCLLMRLHGNAFLCLVQILINILHRAAGSLSGRSKGFEQALAEGEPISPGEEAVSLCCTPSPLAEGFRAAAGQGRGLSWFFRRWGISQDAWLLCQVGGPVTLTPARAEPGKTELLMHPPEVELGIIPGSSVSSHLPRPLPTSNCGQRGRGWRNGQP